MSTLEGQIDQRPARYSSGRFLGALPVRLPDGPFADAPLWLVVSRRRHQQHRARRAPHWVGDAPWRLLTTEPVQTREDAQRIVQAYARRFTEFSCADIMSRGVVSVTPDATVDEALSLLARHRVKALPVIDTTRRVRGIVTRADLAPAPRSAPRDAFARAPDLAAQKEVADAVQTREREVVTHIWLGQWYQPIAARKNVTGIPIAPAPVFWSVEKK